MSQEPSMEEILSSIKRIIAEDGEPGSPLARRGRRMLGRSTEMANASELSASRQAADGGPVTAADDAEEEGADVLELTDAFAFADGAAQPHHEEAGASLPPPAAAEAARSSSYAGGRAEPFPPVAAPPRVDESMMLSEATLKASRQSLAQLSALVVKPEGGGDHTLEGLVRELLRPMMAQWLDAHLPTIVERIVAQEVARLVADSR